MITVDFDHMSLSSGDRVLDIGCGTGRHAGALYVHEKVIIVAGDTQTDDLQKARERMAYHDRLKTHKGGKWFLGVMDISRLPFADESFDTVICSEVLEHVSQPSNALTELNRVLKKDGELAVSVPRAYPERICWFLSKEYRNIPGGHVRIFRYRKLVRLLEGAGFEVFRTHHAHSLHTPYWWLKCLVGPSQDEFGLVRLYNRFLTWDMMQAPLMTHFIDRLLNPLMGKSLVIYANKNRRPAIP